MVTDQDAGDSYSFQIVTQPSNGIATVVNNQLVYTPTAGFKGSDSFQFSATDLGGLSVVGNATVTVTAVSQPANNNTNSTDNNTKTNLTNRTDNGSGGGGSIGPEVLFGLILLALAYGRRRHSSCLHEPFTKESVNTLSL